MMDQTAVATKAAIMWRAFSCRGMNYPDLGVQVRKEMQLL
jgi:hypothetical protein